VRSNPRRSHRGIRPAHGQRPLTRGRPRWRRPHPR
jgi:hypothetical protein